MFNCSNICFQEAIIFIPNFLLSDLQNFRYLELDKPNWPENGLDFLEEIRLAFTSEINVISMGLFIQNSMPCTVYQKLISLFGDLQDLQQLKKDFKIRLTLEEYLQVKVVIMKYV